jgi:hypothetical protein
MADTRKKLLLLVDLNGALGYRCKVALKRRKPDLYLMGKNYYFRADAVSFLKKMSNHYDVCIYASTFKQDAEAAVNALDKDHKEYISKIYDQSCDKQDPQGAKMWDTILDMRKVWGRSGFSKTNTIILDNEPWKVRENYRNVTIIPGYGKPDAKRNTPNTFTRLGQYLILVAESNVADVRQYMGDNPYYNYHSYSFADIIKSQAESDPLNSEDSSPKEIFISVMTKEQIQYSNWSFTRYDGLISLIWAKVMIIDRVCNGEVWYHEKDSSSSYRIHIRAPNQKTYHREMQLAQVLETSEGEALLYCYSDTDGPDTPGVLYKYTLVPVNDLPRE